jgi:hypothetical protein
MPDLKIIKGINNRDVFASQHRSRLSCRDIICDKDSIFSLNSCPLILKLADRYKKLILPLWSVIFE